MTTEERLLRLEKSLNRWRSATMALLGIVAVVFVSGAADKSPEDLKVKSLEIVVKDGRSSIFLGTDISGTYGLGIHKLFVVDGKQHQKSISLGLDPNNDLQLFVNNKHDGKFQVMTMLSVLDTGARLTMASGQPEKQEGTAFISTNAKGGPVMLLQKNGELVWNAPRNGDQDK